MRPMNGHVPHAINRARERYHLRLSQKDLSYLCEECIKGYGRLSRMPDGKERHLLLCHGKPIVAIYAPYEGPFSRRSSKLGTIITILPPEAALVGSQNSPATKARKERARPRGKPPRKARKQ